jgi:glycosyltransferase involved in cell wall biosynthesis
LGADCSILVDPRWAGHHGIGRFAIEVTKRLAGAVPLPLRGSPVDPLDPVRLSLALRGRPGGVFFSPGFNAPVHTATPFVFSIHDLIHLRVPEERSAIVKAYYEIFVKRAVRRCARVVTVSQFSKRAIVEWTGVEQEKVVVAGNGVDCSFRPVGPRYQVGAPYLLYVGNRKPHKNLGRLLEAFALLRRRVPVKLLLSGVADEGIVEASKRLGMAGDVLFSGEIREDELPAYYRGAEALVLPSVYEGFGLTALEAMACGTPVVAANAGALPEVVGDAALLVDPWQPESIAEGMEVILCDSQLRRALESRGLMRSCRYRWSDVAAVIQNVLETR